MQVGQELVQTVVAGRAPEVLGVLVEPRAQDGGNGAATQDSRSNGHCRQFAQIEMLN